MPGVHYMHADLRCMLLGGRRIWATGTHTRHVDCPDLCVKRCCWMCRMLACTSVVLFLYTEPVLSSADTLHTWHRSSHELAMRRT